MHEGGTNGFSNGLSNKFPRFPEMCRLRDKGPPSKEKTHPEPREQARSQHEERRLSPWPEIQSARGGLHADRLPADATHWRSGHNVTDDEVGVMVTSLHVTLYVMSLLDLVKCDTV